MWGYGHVHAQAMHGCIMQLHNVCIPCTHYLQYCYFCDVAVGRDQ